VAAAPQRIASLLSSSTEILFALGLGERIVAVSHECDYPAAARDKPRATLSHIDSTQPSLAIDEQVRQRSLAGASLYGLNEPLLRELRPDLIVTQAQCDVCAVRYADVLDFVRREPTLHNTPVLALNPASLGDILADILRIGIATGATAAAEEFRARLQARIDVVRQATVELPASQRPKVVCIEWTDPLMAAGNWTPELIALSGGTCGLATAGEHSRYVRWEEICQFDPDVLLVAPCGFDLERSLCEARQLERLHGWSELTAVRTGRVHVIDGNAYLNRSGPRMVDSLEIVAHLLHPALFPTPG
jgi:iron complex transport system substrate-binding protein